MSSPTLPPPVRAFPPPGPDRAPPGLSITPLALLPRVAPGAFPSGRGERRLPARPRRSPAEPAERHSPDPIPACGGSEAPSGGVVPPPRPSPPPAASTGTHRPSPGAVPARSRPCMAGAAALSRGGALPRGAAFGPATSQTRLEAVTQAPMCLISFSFSPASFFFFFFLPPLAGVAGKHRDGSRGDNLKYFRVVPAETFPSLEGSKGRGAGRGGRHREMSTLNFLADAGSRAQAANPASGAVGVCWVFSRGKRTGTRRNKRESEAGHSLANPAPI